MYPSYTAVTCGWNGASHTVIWKFGFEPRGQTKIFVSIEFTPFRAAFALHFLNTSHFSCWTINVVLHTDKITTQNIMNIQIQLERNQ